MTGRRALLAIALASATAVGLYGGVCDLIAAAAPASAIPFPAEPQAVMRAAFADPATNAGEFASLSEMVRGADALDDASFTLLGQARARRGDLAGARDAFARARSADPRALAPRLGLIDSRARIGDAEGAIAETMSLLRLRPDLGARVMPILLAVAADRQGRGLVLDAARQNPAVGEGLLAHASGAPDKAGLVDALLAQPGVPVRARKAAISAIAGRGEYRRAYRLWTGRSAATGIADPAFARGDLPEPFGWTMVHDPNGSASLRQGGLAVEMSGTLEAELARQVTLLEPGRYRLTALAREVRGGLVGGRLSCMSGSALIGGFTLSPARPSANAVIDIPAGCDVQSLTLFGQADDPSGTATGRIARVAVERIAP